jgi:hypothetical protein
MGMVGRQERQDGSRVDLSSHTPFCAYARASLWLSLLRTPTTHSQLEPTGRNGTTRRRCAHQFSISQTSYHSSISDSYLGFQIRTMIRQHQILSSTWSFGSTGNQSPSLWSTSPLNERHGQLSSQNPHPHPVVRWDKCHQNDHHCK